MAIDSPGVDEQQTTTERLHGDSGPGGDGASDKPPGDGPDRATDGASGDVTSEDRESDGARSGLRRLPMRRLPMRSRIVAGIVVVALIVAGGWWFGPRGGDDSAADVAGTMTMTDQVVEVTRGDMAQTVSAEGTVAAASTDELSFASAGTVTAVNIAAGDTVTTGQVLATIDSAELEADVASAESDVADAEAKLADDRDADASDEQIAADQASLTSTQDQLTNARDALVGAQLVATFDGTVTQVDLTVGEELGSSGTGGTTRTGSGSGSGQSSATLGSSGALPSGDTSAGSSGGSSGSAQITVVSFGSYTVDLAVDSSDIDSIAVGQSVDLTVSTSSSSTDQGGFPGGGFPGGGGFPPPGATQQTGRGSAQASDETGENGEGDSSTEDRATPSADSATATGIVTEVGKVADASSGVASYPVTVTFQADSSDFYIGTTVVADITTDSKSDVVQVTSRAVTTNNDQSQVTVATDGTADGATETRTVTTGETIDGRTEIVSGLSAGDKVIVQVPSFAAGGQSGQSGQMPGGVEMPSGGQFPGGGSSNGTRSGSGSGNTNSDSNGGN